MYSPELLSTVRSYSYSPHSTHQGRKHISLVVPVSLTRRGLRPAMMMQRWCGKVLMLESIRRVWVGRKSVPVVTYREAVVTYREAVVMYREELRTWELHGVTLMSHA